MDKYNLKKQRLTYYETLQYDSILKWQMPHFKYFDQLGADGKISPQVWKNGLFRFFFNIGLPFVMLLSDFYFLFSYLIKNLTPKDTTPFNRLYVCRERHLYLIAKRMGILSKDDVWFASPFDTFTLPYDAKQIRVLDYTSFTDAFLCFFQSIIIHSYTVFHFGYDYYLLSFKAFDWCMMDMALRNIPQNVDLYFCNICDRCAILIDKLPQHNKIMIQHGAMHFHNNSNSSPYMTLQEDKGFWIWNSLYKNSPTRVYCFTEDDEIALRRSVIANDPEFIHIGYDFRPAFKPNKFSVLIIGMYTLFADKEKEIIKDLQGLDIDVYLKNHPSIDNGKYDVFRKEYNFIFLEGVGAELPDVDLVFSYDSTLAYEYASIGTEVLYYDNFDMKDVKKIVEKKLSYRLNRND